MIDDFWGRQPVVPEGGNPDGTPWLDLGVGLSDVDWVSEAP